ncbi:hypothetical protein P5V15_012365 [Pogonomyrmex californicus]
MSKSRKVEEGEEEEEEGEEEEEEERRKRRRRRRRKEPLHRPVHLASGYLGAGASSSGVYSLACGRISTKWRRPSEFRPWQPRGQFTRVYVCIECTAGCSSMQIHRRRSDLEVVRAEKNGEGAKSERS